MSRSSRFHSWPAPVLVLDLYVHWALYCTSVVSVQTAPIDTLSCFIPIYRISTNNTCHFSGFFNPKHIVNWAFNATLFNRPNRKTFNRKYTTNQPDATSFGRKYTTNKPNREVVNLGPDAYYTRYLRLSIRNATNILLNQKRPM